MQLQPLQQVSVWLDGGPSDDCILPHAIDWASRLDLPLRVIATAVERGDSSRWKRWSVECAHHGVVLETFLSAEAGAAPPGQLLKPNGICALMGNSRSAGHDLLLRSTRGRDVAVLLCNPFFEPLRRVLVLHHQDQPIYLETVARMCRKLEIQPIILILADSEKDANRRQGYAEGVCRAFRVAADFDYVIDCDVSSAVSRAVAWRHCSHLIIERQPTHGSWWQPGGDLLIQLRDVCDSLSILALPAAVGLEVRPRMLGVNPRHAELEDVNEPAGKNN
jgi:hypothetical protein